MTPSPAPSAPDAPEPLCAVTSGRGPRLVLAHGFTQDHRVWGGLDADLAADHEVVAVDLPGHGRSAAVRADVTAGADLLGRTGGTAAYLGYSMGARHCLRLAVDRPGLVTRLVLISGTPGIDGADARAERRRADEALAERLDPSDGSAPADTVEAFVARWVRLPLFGDVPEPALGLEARRQGSPAGLAASLRLAGSGTQEPLWDALPSLAMPILLIAGARDDRYVDLAERMAAAIGPRARLHLVADADHAPHLQRPADVAAVVRAFLDEGP